MTTFYSAEYDENSLNADAAEACLKFAADSSSKIHEITLKDVISKCKLSIVGEKHYQSAFQFLAESYGDISFTQNKKVITLNEDFVPEKVATDLVLGLDLVVNFLGYRIGIDITTHESFVGKKLRKQQSLHKVYTKDFGLDFTIIMIESKRFESHDLETLLRKVIRNGGSCQVVSI